MALSLRAGGDIRGALVPEYHFLDATITATSQAGPRPGGFVPAQGTDLQLGSSGTPDQAMAAAAVAILEGGDVGGATFRGRYDGETLRSCDPPVAPSGWEFVARTTTTSKYTRPHIARLPLTG